MSINYTQAPSNIYLGDSYKNDYLEAREYAAFRRFLSDVSTGRNPDAELAAELKIANDDLLRLKEVRPSDVHVNQVLQDLSVRYANGELIADQVVPVVFTGGKLSGTYYKYDPDDRLSYPDDSAADKTDLAELSENRSTDTFSLSGKGFVETVDQVTLQNQDAVLDELADATENVLYGLAFKREERISGFVHNTANYGSNTQTVSAGTSRWDNTFDSATGTYTSGDPIGLVTAAKDALWSGNNSTRVIGVTSLACFNVLRRHTQMVGAIKYGGTAAAPAIVTKRAIAEVLGLDDILIGAARYNTAQEGQTATYGRLWANNLAILRVAQRPSRRSASFAYTFQDLPTQSDQMFDLKKYTKGGYICRSARFEQTKLIASLCGYLIGTPIAP